MTAFVYVGEYSTACACGPANYIAGNDAPESGAVVAAATGVELQRRAIQQRQGMMFGPSTTMH